MQTIAIKLLTSTENFFIGCANAFDRVLDVTMEPFEVLIQDSKVGKRILTEALVPAVGVLSVLVGISSISWELKRMLKESKEKEAKRNMFLRL